MSTITLPSELVHCQRPTALFDKQKDNTITPEEQLELTTMGELDDIFSYINATLFAQAHARSAANL